MVFEYEQPITKKLRFFGQNALQKFEDLYKMSKDINQSVRIKVAGNSLTPAEILRGMVNDAFTNKIYYDWYVIIELAENNNTPQDALDVLSKQNNEILRGLVAENYNTSPETLSTLSRDADPDVRAAVAKHSKTKSEDLEKLSTDHEYSVRLQAAKNVHASGKTLIKLAEDPVEMIRLAALQNPGMPMKEIFDKADFIFDNENYSYAQKVILKNVLKKLTTSLSDSKCLNNVANQLGMSTYELIDGLMYLQNN